MITVERTQPLSDFTQSVTQTIDRVNETGEIELLTVDGETRAVVLSPAVYESLAREAQLTRDVEAIKESMEQISRGEFMEADAFFEQQHQRLMKMLADQNKGAAE